MDRSSTLVRRNLVLGGLAAVLVAVVALRPGGATSVREKDDLPATFPDFAPDAARRVEVSRTTKKDGKPVTEEIRLVSDDGKAWTIDTAWGYPADAGRVRSFLDKVKGSREKGAATENAQKFAAFGGADGFTEVKVDGAKGAPLVKFAVGKGNAAGLWSDSYLRVDLGGSKPGSRVVVATDFQSGAVGTDLPGWLEQRLFPGASTGDVTRIEIVQPAKERTIVLEKGARGEKDTEDPWTMKSPQEGKVGSQAAGNLARGFTGLFLSEVVDGTAGPEVDAKYGFDKPEAVVTATGRAEKEGAPPHTWKLVVGKKVEGKEHRYVRRAIDGKDQSYVFTVSDWDLRDFQNDPVQFLEKKPEDAKPEGTEPAMGEAPAMEPGMEGTTEPAMSEPGTPPPAMEEPGMDAPPPPPAMDDAPKEAGGR
jgi:uncharacterized protein DUF4340